MQKKDIDFRVSRLFYEINLIEAERYPTPAEIEIILKLSDSKW